jgi:hypothetical protein
MKKSVTFLFKTKGKAEVRLIVKNAIKVTFTARTLYWIRATEVHMEKLAQLDYR